MNVQLGLSSVQTPRSILSVGSLLDACGNRVESSRRALLAAADRGSLAIEAGPGLGSERYELLGRVLADLPLAVQVFCCVDAPEDARPEAAARSGGRNRALPDGARADWLRTEVEAILRRLRCDAIDVLHVPLDETGANLATLEQTAEFIRAGKVRAIGVRASCQRGPVIEAVQALGDLPLASIRLRYSLLDRRCERDLLSFVHSRRIAVIAHSVLETGLLAGKLASPPVQEGPASPLFHPDNLRRVAHALQRGVEPVATRHGASIAEVVLSWMLAQPAIDALVVHAHSGLEAHACAAAGEIELNAAELLAIDRVFERLRLDPAAGDSWTARVRRHAAGGLAVVQRLAGISHRPA